MKKVVLLSVVTAVMLFTGCGDDTKKAAKESAAKIEESTKAATDTASKSVSDAADKAVEAAKKAGEAISEATDKAVDATKEAASDVVDSTKEAASSAVESTKEAASKAVDATKESVAAAATTVAGAVSETTDSAAGAAVFKKCAGCHGVDGKTKALGKSAVIAGEPKEDLIAKINEYKAGTRNVAGMGTLMKGQVASLSDEDIQAVAQYISTLK